MAVTVLDATGRARSPLNAALRLGIGPVMFASLFSLVSNMLYLALPIYTNQVYGRVLTSQSTSTLMVLTLAAMFVFVVSGVIDHYRDQILSAFGVVFDQQVASRTFAALFDAVVRRQGTHAQALRDLDTIRGVLSMGLGTIFDLPWMPLFLIILFVIDPWIGTVTAVGAVILVILAFLQERATHSPLKRANEASIKSYNFTDTALRNGEIVRALGMLPTLGSQWAKLRHVSLSATTDAMESGGRYSGSIKFVRMLIQILTIAIGAWLVVERRIPSGMLFANMILAARALAPIERVVGSWRSLFDGIQAYKRLDKVLEEYEPPLVTTQLPKPTGVVSVEHVNFAPSRATGLVLTNVTFRINAGDILGVIGPSGAGKSTLARLLVGIWKPNSGTVRLDSADVYSWDREDFGKHVAYLPQDTELFAGTVRDNIARFREDANDADVVAAAILAGAHELILRLPNGYETHLGERGSTLSAGQRQRVGLARTVYGDPSFVVLDEPNANLDAEGETALMRAIVTLKARGATVVLISHKPAAFQHADKILLLRDGLVAEYGERDAILQKLFGQAQAAKASRAGPAAAQPAAPPTPAIGEARP